MNATYPCSFKLEPLDLIPNAYTQPFDIDQGLYLVGRGKVRIGVDDFVNQSFSLLLVFTHGLETKSVWSSWLSRETVL